MDPFDLRRWEGFQAAGGLIEQPAFIDQMVIDSRRIDSPRALFVALKGEKEDGHAYVAHAAKAGAAFALVSQDWVAPSLSHKLKLLRVPSPLQAFQAIARAYRLQLSLKIIGVAGSFGKTMVKDLLFALLKTSKRCAASPESFNSQIGVPLSLLGLSQELELGIIEAAISQPEEMDVLADLIHPDYVLVAPIGKKHLDMQHTLPVLTGEILKLAQAVPSTGWTLLPDEFDGEPLRAHLSCPSFIWSRAYPELPHAVPLPADPLRFYQLTFPDGSSYQGHMRMGHAYFLNLVNMAAKAAWLIGVSSTHMISVFEQYQPEPTRTEIWKSASGATFINDVYCSDPQSIDGALRHFDYAPKDGRKIFVFGGMRGTLPQMDYRRIGKALAKSDVRHLLLVGSQPFKPLIEEMQRSSGATEILAFEGYEETFSYLQRHLQSHDLILFKGENKLSFDKLTETFNGSLANNQCVINLAAIQANLALIQKKLPQGTRMMVMVKALAYGTDDVRMAKFLAACGIDILGVSYVDEAIVLRLAGVRQALFAIHAAPYEAGKVVAWDLEVGVSDAACVEAFAREAAAASKQVKVHLHINTGMGRLGCRPEEAVALASQIVAAPSLRLEGFMTHFACADDPNEDAFTLQQAALFDQIVGELHGLGYTPPWVHAANSSGALRFHFPQYNMVRVGLAVYGLYGSAATRNACDLRLAVSLTSRIVAINRCKQGETVSYGRRYCVTRETQSIAVLPIGYFDGLHRHYSGKAHVLIRGEKAPMVGSICMDYMMVDVTDIPQAAVGDKALIFGEDEYGCYLSPEELADSGNSIVHELITCLGPRIQRIFVYEEGKPIR